MTDSKPPVNCPICDTPPLVLGNSMVAYDNHHRSVMCNNRDCIFHTKLNYISVHDWNKAFGPKERKIITDSEQLRSGTYEYISSNGTPIKMTLIFGSVKAREIIKRTGDGKLIKTVAYDEYDEDGNLNKLGKEPDGSLIYEPELFDGVLK